MTFLHVLAQTTSPATTQATSPAPFWANPIFVPLILLAVFLFFSSKTKRTQQKKQADVLAGMKKGDRVQTIGGILGTIVETRENEVLVKVDETNNTKIRFSRKAINRVVEEESTEKK